MNLADFAS